ncbi:MAG: hypothetical protein HN390_14330 [Anaerolineae bacterium]|jgi:hypothetical protein|nr:hypothetical protein [Anaerolineae bacterium]MBT7189535.1 hypothetical protein [Anaerolineae bacterium]MBT7990020.1 hypothetical protein [Anaerolineae bacterium]
MKNEPSYQDSYRPNKELEVVKIQLRSQRSSENWLGMEQVQLWLQKDPEDEEIYAILLESVEENPRINEPVRILLNDLIDKGALRAESALRYMPSASQQPIDNANDHFPVDGTDEASTVIDVNIEGLALSDAYSQIDLLGYSDYVEALANFITSPKTKKPITIGIDAAWGGGKTTLMRLLQERLNPRLKEKGKKSKKGANEHINTVWFDAWKYDQQEMLWAAMVLEIFDQVREQSNWWQKTNLFFRLNSKRFDWARFWLSLLKSVAITIFLFALGSGAFSILASFLDKSWGETLQWVEDYSRVLVALGVASLTYTIFKDTTGLIISPFSLGISQYAKKPDYKEKIGFLNKFTEDFKYVIASITKNGEWPLVVFIDDLDRCSPTKAAEVIEAMNLLLDSEHCVFVLGVDTAMLSRSIQAKYKEIQPFFDDIDYPSSTGLGRHFLEKIIQIDFRIPRSDSTHISDFISAQIGNEPKKREQPVEQQEAENLIQAKQRTGKTVSEAKQIILDERPDLEREIANASKVIEERTFEDNVEVIEAINDMAFYLNNNPRRIKRFINMFRLQALIAYQRRILGDGISFSNLARWVVISMWWPELITFFRQNHSLSKSIKNDAIYINQRKLKEEFITNLAPLNKYPLFIQKLFLNANFRKIITEITGEFEEAQNYLNLTQLITTTNHEENF